MTVRLLLVLGFTVILLAISLVTGAIVIGAAAADFLAEDAAN
jgi:hypothetical protein